MTVAVSYSSNPEGRHALATATAEAQARGSRLVVVASAPRDEAAQSAGLGELRDRLVRLGLDHEVVEVSGDLAEGLVTVAAQADAELIVIGLRRRSPVGKLVLGAGAQRILLESPCAVLAVKS